MKKKIADILQSELEYSCKTCKYTDVDYRELPCNVCGDGSEWKLSSVHALKLAAEILKVVKDD